MCSVVNGKHTLYRTGIFKSATRLLEPKLPTSFVALRYVGHHANNAVQPALYQPVYACYERLNADGQPDGLIGYYYECALEQLCL